MGGQVTFHTVRVCGYQVYRGLEQMKLRFGKKRRYRSRPEPVRCANIIYDSRMKPGCLQSSQDADVITTKLGGIHV